MVPISIQTFPSQHEVFLGKVSCLKEYPLNNCNLKTKLFPFQVFPCDKANTYPKNPTVVP